MNEDINIQVHETSESQLVDADRLEHIQPIIKPGTQLSLASSGVARGRAIGQLPNDSKVIA
jgi:hypothetical protein